MMLSTFVSDQGIKSSVLIVIFDMALFHFSALTLLAGWHLAYKQPVPKDFWSNWRENTKRNELFQVYLENERGVGGIRTGTETG